MKREVAVKGISVFSGRPVEVCIAGDRITRVTEGEDDKELPYLSPAFLDMQVNGYNGSDYSLDGLTREHIERIVAVLGRSGTSQHVPTFISMPQARLLRNLRVTAEAIDESPHLAAAIAGLHVEGPFISSEDGPRGTHDPSFVRDPNFDDFLEWQDAARGKITYITVAPERRGAIEFIRQVVATGAKVAIGHTGAEPAQILEAVEAGARLSTHLGNGSYTTLPRLRNYIWEQLAADRLMASCISDGYHLPESVVRVFARAKGYSRMILVSDAALLGGYPPGLYKWEGVEVEVFEDGHLGLPGTSILAGAAHLLDWDLAHFTSFTECTLAEAVPLCTTNPAAFLGISDPLYGRLAEGAPANICRFRYGAGDSRLHVSETYVEGRLVFEERQTGRAENRASREEEG